MGTGTAMATPRVSECTEILSRQAMHSNDLDNIIDRLGALRSSLGGERPKPILRETKETADTPTRPGGALGEMHCHLDVFNMKTTDIRTILADLERFV